MLSKPKHAKMNLKMLFNESVKHKSAAYVSWIKKNRISSLNKGTEQHIGNGYKYNPVHVFAGSAGYI